MMLQLLKIGQSDDKCPCQCQLYLFLEKNSFETSKPTGGLLIRLRLELAKGPSFSPSTLPLTHDNSCGDDVACGVYWIAPHRGWYDFWNKNTENVLSLLSRYLLLIECSTSVCMCVASFKIFVICHWTSCKLKNINLDKAKPHSSLNSDLAFVPVSSSKVYSVLFSKNLIIL